MARYGFSLKTIGELAFSKCGQLTEVDLGENVQSIGKSAFADCGSLAKLTLPTDTLEMIQDNSFSGTSLTEFAVPASVKTIGINPWMGGALQKFTVDSGNQKYAVDNGMLVEKEEGGTFAYTNKLQNVEFSEGLQIIRRNAFQRATALQRVEFPGSLKTIETSAFSQDTALETMDAAGGKMETIGTSAFSGCAKLKNVLLGGELREIGQSAFYGCADMEEIALPDKVRTLGSSVFFGCSKLEAIDFPNSITSIGSSALNGCTALKWATFGSVIQEITGDVFENCPSITEITVSAKNPHMLAEDNIVYSRDKKKLIYYAAGLPEEKFSVPDGVQIIGGKSFTYCAHLEEIRFPDSVKSLKIAAIYRNKSVSKLFFFGNGPETAVNTQQNGPDTQLPNSDMLLRKYVQYNDSISQNGSGDNQGLWVYALPGTTGWEGGWTKKTAQDTVTGIIKAEYTWQAHSLSPIS